MAFTRFNEVFDGRPPSGMSAAWSLKGEFRGDHHFDPEQPRVPAGNPDGGQWTRIPGWSRFAANETDSPGKPPTRSDAPRISPHVQELGRGRSGVDIGTAVRSLIELIEQYQAEYSLPDLFGYRKGLEEGTVFTGRLDGKPIIGVNSTYGTRTTADRAIAERWRDYLAEKNPELKKKNMGHMPNNAFFHAEIDFLLRAAKENGGTLAGKTLYGVGSRPMCANCQKVLPLLALELGNPTLIFTDYHSGKIRIIRDGVVMEEGR